MSYVPEFVALYEICPYIRNFPLNNDTIHNAVYFTFKVVRTRMLVLEFLKCLD